MTLRALSSSVIHLWDTQSPLQQCHPSLGHPKPSPHALAQIIPIGLPQLLHQEGQFYGNFPGDSTTAWSWQEGETSQV